MHILRFLYAALMHVNKKGNIEKREFATDCFESKMGSKCL